MAREGLQSCCSAVFISAWLQGTFLQDAIIEAHDGQDGQKAITLSLVLHQPAASKRLCVLRQHSALCFFSPCTYVSGGFCCRSADRQRVQEDRAVRDRRTTHQSAELCLEVQADSQPPWEGLSSRFINQCAPIPQKQVAEG